VLDEMAEKEPWKLGFSEVRICSNIDEKLVILCLMGHEGETFTFPLVDSRFSVNRRKTKKTASA
jgi:hypothetical protein